MKEVRNVGNDRVLDFIAEDLGPGRALDVATDSFSLFAFAALAASLTRIDRARFLLPSRGADLGVLGVDADRAARNSLRAPWLAAQCRDWLRDVAEVRSARGAVPQGTMVVRGADGSARRAVYGSIGLSTPGLGLAPGNPLALTHASETLDEARRLAEWFDRAWDSLGSTHEATATVLAALDRVAQPYPPSTVYAAMLHHLFRDRADALDEERVVNAATGIRETKIWKKLFRFQRDGVIGAIDKLDRYGGCILADSVGLGKTFEALAVVKYHELRNGRVLVLCPKRLRDNWTLYKSNDRRNVLASDRLNYDVLNHTDLSRDLGSSGDVDLSHVNWGNYDLVVIDESHNFRNKKTPRQGSETRYDRLMRRVIREGVRTRVLMLSATPVNNRLADLRNQLAFATEGNDTALAAHGIPSVDATTRLAQKQFNRWLELDHADRTSSRLIEMLGFDYFALLDLLTIARSRKHVEKYYGTTESGRFPDRLQPVNIKADVDSAGLFRSIRDINLEIQRLHLASYSPLKYVFENKRAAYDEKYGTKLNRGGYFTQTQREESLVHLLRVNVLKRMESAVSSFALTVERQLWDVEETLRRIDAATAGVDVTGVEIGDVDPDDPEFEGLLVGRKIKVLLKDVDRIKWKQDLVEDRNRLAALRDAARQVGASRDAKLAALREVIAGKCAVPLNAGNRKVIVFTAFADTAEYLFEHLAPWARESLGVQTALVTGSNGNKTTLPEMRRDLGTILTAFSPRSKERPEDLAHEGELDLLIATDCISEGQNLQDCDCLVNYDIHWNPVRIIQRFGRIDRIGSRNARIQLVNFWPNMQLEEYLTLEQRVTGRMVLLDVSATGEENVIEHAPGDPMNDLEYRRKQLLKLQDAVIDLEDLSSGVSIADLSLGDFRLDLARFTREQPDLLDSLPLGVSAVVTTRDTDIRPGVVFCLRADETVANRTRDDGYPLAPHYVVHVGADGAVALGYAQARQVLDALKRLCVGRDVPDEGALARFSGASRRGDDMRTLQGQLAAAVASVTGRIDERAVASLFAPGGTHALAGEFGGTNDFEVVAYLVVLEPEPA